MKQFLTLILVFIFSSATLMAQDATPLIKRYLLDNQKQLQLSTDEAAAGWMLSDQYLTKHNQVTHAYVQQTVNGLKLYNAISSAAIKDGVVAVFNSRFTPGASNLANALPGAQRLDAREAVLQALKHLNIDAFNLKIADNATSDAKTCAFTAEGAVTGPIKVNLLYKNNTEEMRLAWNVEIHSNSDWWHLRVDAMTGEVLDKGNYTVYCQFHPNAYEHDCVSEHPVEEQPIQAPQAMTNMASAYRVLPFPTESPVHANNQLIQDPFLPSASPFGWHDTDGQAGAEYTITRGNNVFASEDRDADNQPGYSPDGGPNLLFDFPYNALNAPITWQDAAITNLFYANNIMHDMAYAFGFDEEAGNYQENNYGKGGIGTDAVQADAQDGSGTNNANFSAPPDGSSGRMQMYIWTGGAVGGDSLRINAPAAIAGTIKAPGANFGPTISTPLTGDVVLAVDGTAPVNNGCETILNANELNGKIALIDRGLCNYAIKVKIAQDAGAIGVIVVQNGSGGPLAMPGSDPSIIIPSVMVSLVNGNLIKAQLLNGPVNVSFLPPPNTDRDSDLDNGIIAHEFGHGISIRLTGGASNSGCLDNAEQMGEGWSDFYSLITTIRAGDTRESRRPVGTYSLGQPTNGSGIRNQVYSADMNVNNYTYGYLPNTQGLVHNVGELWATMLWDMTWDLIDQYGFEPNMYAATGGNNIAQQLVMDGFKIQQCNPGFVDGRNAILDADRLKYNGANKCLIWKAFARRGLGYSAKQGSSDNISDGVEAFDVPPTCLVATAAPIADFTVDRTSTCLDLATFQFTDQSQNIAQYFLWDFGDGSTSTETNPTHRYLASGSYTVSLVITNNIGVDTLVRTNYITVQDLPVPSINDQTVCSGQNVPISSTPSSAENIFEWYDAAGNLVYTGVTTPSLSTTSTFSVNEAGVAPIQKVGPLDFGGGGNHNTQFIGRVLFTAEKAFTIKSVLVRAQGAGNRDIRLYDAAGQILTTLTVNIPNGDSRVTLNLKVPAAGSYGLGAGPNVNLFRSNSDITFPYTIDGLVTITGSNSTNRYYYFYDWEVQPTPCRSASTNVTLNVVPGPLANFSSVKNGLSVTFSDLSTGAPATWLWNFGDGNTATTPNPTHVYAAVGAYTVTLTVSNGNCTHEYTQVVDFTSGTSSLDALPFNVHLQPNPASSLTNLSISGAPGSRMIQVGLYHADGRLVHDLPVDLTKNEVLTLDLKGLAAGVYLVKVQAAAGIAVKKLVIQ